MCRPKRLVEGVIGLRLVRPICVTYLAGAPMDAAKPALIRETFPVGPLQCNCTI